MTITTIKNGSNLKALRPKSYCRQEPRAGMGQPIPPVPLPRREILLGDATERLRTLPDDSIDTVVTSPPYYQIRDYFVTGQLGLESHIDVWVDNLRAVFREVARVLKPSGSMWLNLGDSFSRHDKYGAPPKSLLAGPERMLLALMQDGWIVRGKVIWSKPNGLPNSVADRPNLNYEVVYFLVREQRYFFNLDAIREPPRSRGASRASSREARVPQYAGPLASGSQDGLRRARPTDQPGHPLGKNPGSVWEVPTYGFRGNHFATFPPRLIHRPILATCPEAICTRCGTQWKRQVIAKRIPGSPASSAPRPNDRQVMRFGERWHTVRSVGDLIPCGCCVPTLPGVVLDPFMGAGTTAIVAEELERDWIGIELSEEYRDLALRRIEAARQTAA